MKSALILLFLALIFEGTITFLPLTLLVILILFIRNPKEGVLYVAFPAGVILDVLTLKPLGLSSAFFLVLLFLILQYSRKFEISTVPFVIISTFLGSFLFLVLGGQNSFIPSLLSAVLGLLMFKLISKVAI